MKKKIILAIASMIILGLSIAAFAYSGASVSPSNAASCCCCCSGDSCPMKSKDAKTGEKASCCDKCDCCKGDAESCPMKTKGEKPQTVSHQTINATAAADSEGCCCSCCKKDKEKKDAPAA